MTYEFELPDVGEGITEAEILRWLVEPGDEVAEDDPVVEIETDKATMDVGAPVDGVVAELLAEEGEVVGVGDVFVRFETGDAGAEGAPSGDRGTSTTDAGESGRAETGTESPPGASAPTREPDAGAPVRGSDTSAPVQQSDKEVLATPHTRRRAHEESVDLSAVEPSDRDDGRPVVTEADLEAHLADRSDAGAVEPTDATAANPAGGATDAIRAGRVEERIPYKGVWRRAGKHLEESWFTAVHALGQYDVDVTDFVALRDRLKPRAEERGVRLTYNSFILKAVAVGLREYPIVNSQLDEENQEILVHDRYNVGVAVATEQGLRVPVIEDVDQKSVLEIAAEIDEFVEKAANDDIAPEDMRGGTFTVTNTGALGSEHGMPIINYPEVAILSIGRIEQKPRVVDGEEAVGFVNEVRERLENPELLLLE